MNFISALLLKIYSQWKLKIWNCYNYYFLDSLQSFADDITNTVNVDVILPLMIQEGLVSVGEQQDLSSVFHSMAVKQQKLCSIILALPEGCVNKFLRCLFETKHYEPHKLLYDKLQNTDD